MKAIQWLRRFFAFARCASRQHPGCEFAGEVDAFVFLVRCPRCGIMRIDLRTFF